MLKTAAFALGLLAPVAAPCIAQAQTPEPGGRDRPPVITDDIKVQMYGYVQLDGIYDFNRVDPVWVGGFRPSKIPTEEGIYGEDGQANFSARQTLFGVSGEGIVDGKPIKVAIEFDLFGTGSNAGETTFHLQRASVEWGPIMAGYNKSLFMDPDLWPNIIDFWGPSGMIYVKNAGIRYTFVNSDTTYFAAGLELPGNDVDPGLIRVIDPDLGANLTNTQKYPDFHLAGKYSGDWGHVRLAGVARSVGFETAGSPGGEPNGDELGWGLDLTGVFNLGESSKFRAGYVWGDGIASYFNDGGTDLAPTLTNNLTVEAEAGQMYGVMAYLDHSWNDKFSSSIGVSRTNLENTNLQDGDAFHRGDYASVNLLYNVTDALMVGGELMYGSREDKDGDTGEDTRIQFSLRYSYGVTVMGRQ